jgi:mono/diheme cytochrome c family protein
MKPVRKCLLTLTFVFSAFVSVMALSACGGNPAGPTPASAQARGQVVFSRYCNSCHPGGGRGAGPALPMLVASRSDDELRSVVRGGKNRMPAFGPEVIPDDQLSDLIAYLRTLK